MTQPTDTPTAQIERSAANRLRATMVARSVVPVARTKTARRRTGGSGT